MPARLPEPPFVLLDDARDSGAAAARLYAAPVEVIEAKELAEVAPALDRLRECGARGLHVAGFLSYEAGHALEPRLQSLGTASSPDGAPLLWFGLFERYEAIAPEDVPALFGSRADVEGPLRPAIELQDYARAFDRVARWIVDGDIYQVNLTFPCAVDVPADVEGLYATVRNRAKAGYGALIRTGAHDILSFSPELFFAVEGDSVTTRPMKGTALRLPDAAADAAAGAALVADAKQRAENLMIVDLLRNDLSRVAVPGSVEVPDLFRLESYPTVHQMTSTVTARLRPGLDAVDVIRALFPCGSITGAPKLRAMEIIHAIEPGPRGIYTGAIGSLDPAGNCAFNVAIRTISVKKGSRYGVMGLGSGVVADSVAVGEWHECLDKGRFLAPVPQDTRG